MNNRSYQKPIIHVPFYIVYSLSVVLTCAALMHLSHWVFHKMESLTDVQSMPYRETPIESFISISEVRGEIVRLRIEYGEFGLFNPVPVLNNERISQDTALSVLAYRSLTIGH